MSKYFTDDFATMQDWRKVETLLTELNRIYMTANINEQIDDADMSDIDIALRTISDYRARLFEHSVK